MALEMQKIYEEDSAKLKRQKNSKGSRSELNQGIMNNFFLMYVRF